MIDDLRDIRELWNSGTIPGSVHAPRGMLEFWVDPDSPYHRDVFSSGKKLVFFCAAGWRSALATKAVQDMGVGPVAHIGGGFGAWTEAEAPSRRGKRSEALNAQDPAGDRGEFLDESWVSRVGCRYQRVL